MGKCDCRFKNFFHKEWSLTEKVLWTTTIMAVSVLFGIILSPVKKGVVFKPSLGCHNGNNNNGTLPITENSKKSDSKQKKEKVI